MSKIISQLLNKRNPSLEDRILLLEELYWADWEEVSPSDTDKIFKYLSSDKLGIQEMSKALSLYNNVAGEHTEKFAQIIANYYIDDKIKFFKALNLNKDEAIHLVYIFKMLQIFEDGDREYTEIKSTNELTDEELDIANAFFSMFKTICNT